MSTLKASAMPIHSGSPSPSFLIPSSTPTSFGNRK